VNAKNSYSGYIGEKEYKFFVHNDQIACAFGEVQVRNSVSRIRII